MQDSHTNNNDADILQPIPRNMIVTKRLDCLLVYNTRNKHKVSVPDRIRG